MLNPNTIRDLNKAFEAAPQGFVVVDQGMPRFVVIDYETYKKFKEFEQPLDLAQGKILVTGGAGYIGSVTVRVLEKAGYEVIVYDNLSTGSEERVRDSKLIVADLSDKETLRKTFAENKIDAVIHFAATIESEESIMNPSKYFASNVVCGINLLDTMVEFGVGKLVFSSSAAVYGEPTKLPITEDSATAPTNPYGESKLIFERMLRWYSEAYDLHSVSLRYFNAAGAWPEEELGYNHQGHESHLIPKVLDVALGDSAEIVVNGQDYATADGTCIRDYVHVLDLAEAHIAALKKLQKANGAYLYNVGTGIGYSILEIIDAAVESTARMIPMRVGPRRMGDPSKLIADVSRMKIELGWMPKHALKDILDSSWQWQRRGNK